MERAQIIPFPGVDAPEEDVRVPGTDLDVSDLTRPLCQLNVFRLRERLWVRHLNPTENVVLGHLLDRTVGWQRDTARLTVNSICDATGKGRSQVHEALRSLREKRVIGSMPCPTGTGGLVVTVNVNWRPKMPLAIPKRPRPVRNADEGVSGIPDRGYPESRTGGVRDSGDNREADSSYTSSHNVPARPAADPVLPTPRRKREVSGGEGRLPADSPENPRAIPESAPGFKQAALFDAVDAAEQAVKARGTVKHQDRRQKATVEALEATWRLAWAEKFAGLPGSECPAWSKAERGKVKMTLCRLPLPPESLHDMLEWVVRDYDAILGTHFRGLKNPAPVLPTISWVAGMGKGFWTAWTRSRQQDFSSTLADADRREYLRLTRDARMTHEEAIAEVTRQKVLKGEFAALEREKEEVARQRRIAERMTQRPAFTTDAPHPGSVAAARAARSRTSPDDIAAALAKVDWRGGR